MEGSQRKVGILSVYQQDWALTRYVDRLRSYLPNEEVLVFAEEVSASALRVSDQTFVRRCWKRGSTDYSRLRRNVLDAGIRILHLNCCYPFFDNSEFSAVIRDLRMNGVMVVAHLQDLSALYAVKELLCTNVDALIVDSQKTRMLAIIAGVPDDIIHILPVALDDSPLRDSSAAPRASESGERTLVGFDFGASTEKLEDLIRALYELNPARSRVKLYIVQLDMPRGDDQISQTLARRVASLNLNSFVEFVNRDDPSQSVPGYIAKADVIVLSASRPLMEVREVLGLALQAGKPIVTNSGVIFDGLEGAVFSVQKDGSLSSALQTVLGHKNLQSALSAGCAQWAHAHSAGRTGGAFKELYQRTAAKPETVRPETAKPEIGAASRAAASAASPAIARRTLRILMQNRSNTFTQPGGDTMVMERLSRQLRRLGHTVDIDVEGKADTRRYDLVHLYNFAIKEATEQMARNCQRAGSRYVVTTLYEDWPVFYNQMANLYFAIKAYVEAAQPRDKWSMLLQAARDVKPAPAWDNTWAAEHAAALIASGSYERDSLLRDYPRAKQVEICHFGSEVAELNDGGALFTGETGLTDFVLMVGRLEWRKNQLMLLKALEDSELPVVFATGGFTYQPEYEAVCRAFKRRGKTIFLGRLEPHMLASAFAAARVHVLPSWFELPGLVSLEAARYGTNVVVSDYGTARDYLGNLAFYCKPDDDASILAAITAAYQAPRSQALRDHVQQFTWDAAARRTLEIYFSVLENAAAARPEVASGLRGAAVETHAAKDSVAKIPEIVGREEAGAVQEAEAFCAEGDSFAAQGRMAEAGERYRRALVASPHLARAHRSLGVVALTERNFEEAGRQFREALRSNPQDAKALTGLGSAEWELGRREEAFELFQRACDLDHQGGALLYFLNAAYALNRLSQLEAVLRRYLRSDRENLNLQYCLAGCYFKQEKYALASGMVERMLQVKPDYREALELREEIARRGGFFATRAAAPEPQAAAAQPATSDYTRQLGLLEEDKKRRKYDEIIESTTAIIAAGDAKPWEKSYARVLKGEALACKNKIAEADAELRMVAEDADWGYRATAGLGALAAAGSRYEEARTLFERSLAMKPNHDVAIAGLGLCEQAAGNAEGAWRSFMQAFTTNMENSKALYGLIQLGYSLGRLPETERALRQYLELRPVDLGIIYSLAGCLYAQGKGEEAIEHCRRILLFEPDHRLAIELLEKLGVRVLKEAPTKDAGVLGRTAR